MLGTTTLDERDVRGWHFVLTGSLLLLVPPDGEVPGHIATRDRYGTCQTFWADRHAGWTPTDEAAMSQRILDAVPPDWALEDFGDLIALAVVAQARGVLPLGEGGSREPLWVGGPVPLPA